jgi:hypothetical protein
MRCPCLRAVICRLKPRFDREERNSPKWRDWETKENHKYAIVHDGRLYPVKEIVSLASGAPTSSFSGGAQANGLVRKVGFNVEALHLPTEREVQIALHELLLAQAPSAIEPALAYETLADQFALPQHLRPKRMENSDALDWGPSCRHSWTGRFDLKQTHRRKVIRGNPFPI